MGTVILDTSKTVATEMEIQFLYTWIMFPSLEFSSTLIQYQCAEIHKPCYLCATPRCLLKIPWYGIYELPYYWKTMGHKSNVIKQHQIWHHTIRVEDSLELDEDVLRCDVPLAHEAALHLHAVVDVVEAHSRSSSGRWERHSGGHRCPGLIVVQISKSEHLNGRVCHHTWKHWGTANPQLSDDMNSENPYIRTHIIWDLMQQENQWLNKTKISV